MRNNSSLEPRPVVEITLDGVPVELPAEGFSLNAIRAFLEMQALGRQRVLHSLIVDGARVNSALPMILPGNFSRIEAETMDLADTSLRLLETAWQQVNHTRECIEAAVTLVLINDIRTAREIWWNLAGQLKEPVLTLSLLPDNACGPANGRASLAQLRKWQLQQIAAIIRDVDAAGDSADALPLSNALENRVLPWLQKLAELIHLWSDTAKAGSRLGIKSGMF